MRLDFVYKGVERLCVAATASKEWRGHMKRSAMVMVLVVGGRSSEQVSS